MNRNSLFLVIMCFLSCNIKTEVITSPSGSTETTTIAFGSCAHEDEDQPIWQAINQHQPDLWIWLGDIVYGDTHNMDTLKHKYDMAQSKPGYRELKSQTPVIGVYDDHDYGINDGGKYYSQKADSKKLLMDFLEVPTNHPARNREGAYSSHWLEDHDHAIKIILLDTRYFRDTLVSDIINERKRYVPNPDGDVLGEEQWTWLEEELIDPKADLVIVGSSIQFISEDHGYEKWGNFPTARQRMLDLLVKTQPGALFFISGDRHIAEFSRQDVEGLPYSVYDFTASGMTHTWSSITEEANPHRIGELIAKKNFGLINIQWSPEFKVNLEVRGLQNDLLQAEELKF